MMNRSIFKLFLFLAAATSLFAEKGHYSVYIFFDGIPQPGYSVELDDKKTYETDKSGAAAFDAEEGMHTIIVKKNGIIQGSGRIKVIANEAGQMVVSLSGDKASISKEEAEGDVMTPEEKARLEAAKHKPKGFLAASVISTEDKAPIVGARVFVKGMPNDATTDDKGGFQFELPEGNYSISLIHPNFSTQTIPGIEILSKETSIRTFEMSPAGLELEEFVVLAPYIEGSLASVMQEEKKSNAIANILSSEEFSKKGDGNAAAALKRVTGVTLIGGKSVFVRGLGERYSNIEMNSMPLPSPDPTKRVVPLDIFPSSVIGSLKVQKSATADIPASFGGGYIDIRTKESSKEDYAKISVGLNANSYTGKKTDTYQGSSTDWLGYDDGYREIDPLILNNLAVNVGSKPPAATKTYFTEEELSDMTQSYINREYGLKKESLPIGYSGSIEGEKTFSLFDKDDLSVSGNYGYSQSHKYKEETYNNYEFELATNKLHTTPDQSGTILMTSSDYSHGGILNVGYTYNDTLKLKLTSLYTHNSEKSTRTAEGEMGSNNTYFKKIYLEWEERTLNVNQLSATKEYDLFSLTSFFDVGAEMASAKLYQPNNYYYAYIKYDDIFKIDTESGSNHIAKRVTSDDALSAYYVKNKLIYDLFSNEDYFEIGYSASNKVRESRQSKYYLRKMRSSVVGKEEDIDTFYADDVTADISYTNRDYIVSPLFKGADSFDATVRDDSYYVSTFAKPTEKTGVTLGMRFVDFSQTMWQYVTDSTNPDLTKRGLIIRSPEEFTLNDSYPSASLKYTMNDSNIFDFAVSKTYIVPDLREFSEGEYFHPYEVATVKGNPDLVNTDIMSYDLQFTHYFSEIENIKFGLFYKELDKPIEDVMEQSSSLPTYGYRNTDSATLQGVELDGRKNLSMIDDSLEPFYFAGNFSYTDSLVKLTEEQKKIFSTDNRQLQGLSKTVINATVGYEDDEDSIVFTYNKMGERIRKVGLIDDTSKYPDNYEIPPELLDFIWSKKFENDMELKLKIQNILDSKTIWKQGDNITKEYKTGTNYSLSYGYKF